MKKYNELVKEMGLAEIAFESEKYCDQYDAKAYAAARNRFEAAKAAIAEAGYEVPNSVVTKWVEVPTARPRLRGFRRI